MGSCASRSLWQNYYGETAAIIFVIDLADKERFEEARIELWNVIRHENTRGAPILIYANKEVRTVKDIVFIQVGNT